MLAAIKTIENLKKQIDDLRPFDDKLQDTLQQRLRIEWTYNSNAIEGNTLTFGETAFFLREGLTSEGKPLKDYLEARNHAEAIDGLMSIVQNEREMTEALIKQLHAVLMNGIDFTYAKGANNLLFKKKFHAGQYKIQPNHVLTISGKIHYYADPLHVKDEMEQLLNWYYENEAMNPIEKAAIFHYKFVSIHPFDDGNGRMARLLMNLILMKNKYPPCIIKNINRRIYLQSLEKVDAEKNYEIFIEFVASQLLDTMKMMLGVLRGKDSGLPILTTLNQSQREELVLKTIHKNKFTISQIRENLPQIKRPTLKSDLKRLVLVRKLQTTGQGKASVYFIA